MTIVVHLHPGGYAPVLVLYQQCSNSMVNRSHSHLVNWINSLQQIRLIGSAPCMVFNRIIHLPRESFPNHAIAFAGDMVTV